jgi:chemotaxis-related protein WspD
MTLHSTAPCWSRIGISGDGSCSQLVDHVHCRNCPEFASAGRKLLDCRAPAGYVSEWTRLLAQGKTAQAARTETVLVFRLGPEWLALSVRRLKEITPMRVLHRLPHRASGVLLGLANIRGEIHLCVSLKEILGIKDDSEDACVNPNAYRRMAVLEKDKDRWVTPVDEIHGTVRFDPSVLRKVPVTVAKAAVRFTRGMLPWQEKFIGLLDDELLFYALKRSALSKATDYTNFADSQSHEFEKRVQSPEWSGSR